MKSLFKIFFILALFVLSTSACTHEKGIILFNTQRITRETALYNSKTFEKGQRIYYLFIAPKRMDNEFIRVQIFKMTKDAPWGGYEVKRTKDFRLMKDEKYYHTDYFVLHESGRYVMQVFSMENLQHPLSIGDFYVR